MMRNYVTLSIETHLFFARIMKEHAFFLAVGFPCSEKEWIRRAHWFRQQFEQLLTDVVRIADGRVGESILSSEALVTPFTISAERRTGQLSGVPFNTRLTAMEQGLRPERGQRESCEMMCMAQQLNRRSLELLNGLIQFKENILREVRGCRLFTANYPLMIEHIMREAMLYRQLIRDIMENQNPDCQSEGEREDFWNEIMREHALFIRGMLDPTEEKLIDTANGFAEAFKELLEAAEKQACCAQAAMTEQSRKQTMALRDFKQAGTQGILNCEIQSIILSLLADHVLREANHYLRILES